jgi:hypothetical protein
MQPSVQPRTSSGPSGTSAVIHRSFTYRATPELVTFREDIINALQLQSGGRLLPLPDLGTVATHVFISPINRNLGIPVKIKFTTAWGGYQTISHLQDQQFSGVMVVVDSTTKNVVVFRTDELNQNSVSFNRLVRDFDLTEHSLQDANLGAMLDEFILQHPDIEFEPPVQEISQQLLQMFRGTYAFQLEAAGQVSLLIWCPN